MLALSLLLVLTMSATAQDEPATKPDIVVIYLDDVDPHDARLWKNARRTPTLSSMFAKAGVQFTSAVSETPLCSPGRGSMLTGRHSVNHGVTGNVAEPFDPRVTIGSELNEAGYQTVFVGKYLNNLREEVKPHQLKRHARGWDEFEIIYEDNGRFYDYAMWSPDGGMEQYGDGKAEHSTLVIKRKLVEHIRNAPDDQPLFAFASIYDLHQPNTPATKHEDAKACRNIKAWTPPSFDASVKGKPQYVREFKDAPSERWWQSKMRTYCEEMLAVEELTKAVVNAQKKRGRHEDTIYIFTADNGVAWGIHRLPQRKGVPYATPIPLVFSSPARWGEDVVEMDEVVSNIDIAPTICALAGCEMGPFKEGPESADGLSLLPLLDGETDHLERTVVREEGTEAYANGKVPYWQAIRTTDQHPLGRWHYVEYEGGKRELYVSVEDPWELTNLVRDEAYAEVVQQLAADLAAEFSSDAKAA